MRDGACSHSSAHVMRCCIGKKGGPHAAGSCSDPSAAHHNRPFTKVVLRRRRPSVLVPHMTTGMVPSHQGGCRCARDRSWACAARRPHAVPASSQAHSTAPTHPPRPPCGLLGYTRPGPCCECANMRCGRTHGQIGRGAGGAGWRRPTIIDPSRKLCCAGTGRPLLCPT